MLSQLSLPGNDTIFAALMDSILNINGLAKRYNNVEALKGLNLEIQKGFSWVLGETYFGVGVQMMNFLLKVKGLEKFGWILPKKSRFVRSYDWSYQKTDHIFRTYILLSHKIEITHGFGIEADVKLYSQQRETVEFKPHTKELFPCLASSTSFFVGVYYEF